MMYFIISDSSEHQGVRLPQKDEVDLIVAGPPCQGFSLLNRSREMENSKLKNGLIFTFLSFCDVFRPKYVVLENVTGLIHFNKNEILQCIFHCFLKMHYQVTFDVLQSGNYGVAQSRNRVIILASKAGYKLPYFPKPLHAFPQQSVTVNGNLVENKTSLAPYRSITVRDAISDLPPISQGANEYLFYNPPKTHFQRKVSIIFYRLRNKSAAIRTIKWPKYTTRCINFSVSYFLSPFWTSHSSKETLFSLRANIKRSLIKHAFTT